MSLYWTAEETIELREAQMQMWLTDLDEFDLECITAAVTEWRQEQTRRPLPADIRRLAVREQRKRPALPPPPFRPRLAAEHDEERNSRRDELLLHGIAIGNAWAQDRGFPDLDAFAHAHGLGYAEARTMVARSFLNKTKPMPLASGENLSAPEKDQCRVESLQQQQEAAE